MKRRNLVRPIHEPRSAFAGFRFPPDAILIAVRWYLRYGLSYRDLEELLAERNIEVDHVTVFRWVQRFTALLVEAARPCRHAPGGHWFVDETYVNVSRTGGTSTGRWTRMVRSSTCSCPRNVIGMLRPGSSCRPSLPTASHLRSPRTGPTPGAGGRGALPGCSSRHNPIRQQPGRSRPRRPG
jgi:hypothetical protein